MIYYNDTIFMIVMDTDLSFIHLSFMKHTGHFEQWERTHQWCGLFRYLLYLKVCNRWLCWLALSISAGKNPTFSVYLVFRNWEFLGFFFFCFRPQFASPLYMTFYKNYMTIYAHPLCHTPRSNDWGSGYIVLLLSASLSICMSVYTP